MTALQTQVRTFQNAARTASGLVNDGYSRVWQQFQGVRFIYGTFKSTLTPQQVNYGANELADLDAGLDIIQEGFTEYQQDGASGQSSSMALRDMCRVLDQAMAVWLQQLNRNSSRLRVGWGSEADQLDEVKFGAVGEFAEIRSRESRTPQEN